ncbi:G-type lectin S-receptor-like serine/threonine-protein kinase At4g27290 [Solanum verrucosum]|uniref:G-type lectin S-receptor-like serine/threonine-protein kinase At4g27290 n=1 Tax=Solanum verrucosum TaxID=315347 RepID=UPI0020D0B591|nr:G-type lectin S-receptor-like serine/threonine-protein kinase At4g27290 [Solanum verrucosum]
MKFLAFLFIYFNFLSIVLALDTITIDQPIKDGDTIVSSGGVYELGFFRPGNSTNRYVGIWYKKISTGTIVWVANRNNPLSDSSGVLMINPDGILVLVNSTNVTIWSTNSSTILKNPIARLLDSGNLAIREENENRPEFFAWQSFDYPGDTLLPGMKLGRNLVTGLDWYISSWKSPDDPAIGEFVDRMDVQGYPQLFVWKGSSIAFSSGPWNGLAFSASPSLQPNTYFTFGFVLNQEEVYYKYDLKNRSLLARVVLTSGGLINHYTWIDRTQSWFLYLTAQFDNCDRFALCGPYARCVINNSPPCDCLRGFEPKYPQEWDAADWSSGCVRRTPLVCQQDGFRKFTGIKVPDTRKSWFNESIGLEECGKLCLADCNCTAYSNMDVRDGGSGCLLWFGDLIDIRELSPNQQDLFVRVAASEVGNNYLLFFVSLT